MAPSDPVTFPKSKLTKTLLGRIVQLEFELSPSETIGMMTVSAFINLMPRNDNNPYPWCEIPMLYHKALEIAIFRYEILKIAATDNVAQGGNKVHILCANLNLAYMDRILSRLFKDARAQPGSINVNWRHEQFDEWTRTEFHVRKHSPDDISAWKLLHPGVSLTLGAIDALDWDLYDTEVHEWLNGIRWKYSVPSMKVHHDVLVVGRYVAAYLVGDEDSKESCDSKVVVKREDSETDDVIVTMEKKESTESKASKLKAKAITSKDKDKKLQHIIEDTDLESDGDDKGEMATTNIDIKILTSLNKVQDETFQPSPGAKPSVKEVNVTDPLPVRKSSRFQEKSTATPEPLAIHQNDTEFLAGLLNYKKKSNVDPNIHATHSSHAATDNA